MRSYLAVPGSLGPRARCSAGCSSGTRSRPASPTIDERLAEGIAAHAAVAIDNARLYEAQRQSRELAERAQRRLAVLADASRVLASSLDVDRILEELSGIVAPTMADSCVVFLAGDDGLIRQVVAAPTTRRARSRRGLPHRRGRYRQSDRPQLRHRREHPARPTPRAGEAPTAGGTGRPGTVTHRRSSCRWSGGRARWECWR